MKIRAKPEVHDHVFDEYDHQFIEPSRVYEVIGIDHESFRVIDEAGEPILYPKYLFEIKPLEKYVIIFKRNLSVVQELDAVHLSQCWQW